MAECMLTTVDNPYNPFEDYPSWFAFDTAHSYHTGEFLARVLDLGDESFDSLPDYHTLVEEAIDEIVRENVLGMWRKVTRSSNNSD